MTIQNIEDVMDRIMSLNRNLNEESLKTLLSASGWDREDILEGIRIFRATNKDTVVVEPILSRDIKKEEIDKNLSKEVVVEDIIQEKPYTFNFKRNENPEETTDVPKPPVEISLPVMSKGKVLENIEKTASEVESFMNAGEALITEVAETDSKEKDKKVKKKSGRLGGIILLLVLLLLLLGATAAYIFLPSFTKWVDKTLSFGNNSGIITKEVDRGEIKPNINTNPNVGQPNQNSMGSLPVTEPTQIVPVQPTTTTTTNIQVQNAQIQEIIKEIEKLKSDLNTYKNSIPEAKTQTIVRYVSQKGVAGRGILSIAATTTGFFINYTDKTSEIVPYSTSTLTDVLNSQRVCFRDMNATTSSTTDVCLDKNSVLDLFTR